MGEVEVAACVHDAFAPYIPRIGKPPQRGYPSIYLATHELMVENRALYGRRGYVEYDHRVDEGLPRVFMRKALA